jgi:hypothetical protein
MKSSIRIAISLAIISICAFAQVPSPPQFSADLTVTSKQEGEQTKGKMFFDKRKIRMDMNAQGHNMSTISDSTTQTSYVLMHDQHMYMEMSANGAGPMRSRGPKMPDIKQLSENPCASEKDTTCKKVGTEMMNGRMCDKWEFTSAPDAENNRTAWIDQKTHIPIKTVSADGRVVEFTKLKEGPQDPKVFEIPAGYQKFDMGAMMQRRGRDQ